MPPILEVHTDIAHDQCGSLEGTEYTAVNALQKTPE